MSPTAYAFADVLDISTGAMLIESVMLYSVSPTRIFSIFGMMFPPFI